MALEIMSKKKPIDKVTTDRLSAILKICNIQLSFEEIDKIIDIVELIEDRGGKTSLSDIDKLKKDWEDYSYSQNNKPAIGYWSIG